MRNARLILLPSLLLTLAAMWSCSSETSVEPSSRANAASSSTSSSAKADKGVDAVLPTAAPTPLPIGEDTLATIAREARGFSVGPLMAAKAAYVFFDPQCPHCGALWEAAKPLASKARLVWIPVRVLGPRSLGMGAAILASPDPVAAMNSHEEAMANGKRGISGDDAPNDVVAQVESNTQLFRRLNPGGVPFVVYRDASGKVATQDGAVDTATLAALLGA